MPVPNKPEWRKGNPEHFTGDVWIGTLSDTGDSDDVRVLTVQFTPGSRTNWHSHAEGQVLHILAGEGIVVNDAGDRLALRQGDTVRTPAGELHWHGATPSAPMLQMSVTTGGGAQWSGLAVTDEEYQAAIEPQ